MANDRQPTWQERFISRPPALAGGVSLTVGVDGDHLLLRLDHEANGIELSASFLSVPYPSGLRRLLARQPEIDAVIVEHIPSGLDAAAKEAGISYLDKDGFGRIAQPGFVYVVRSPVRGTPKRISEDGPDAVGKGAAGEGIRLGAGESRPRRSARRQPRVSPFAPKASRLTRSLLAYPTRTWRLSDLAKLVRVDPGNAHRILGALLDLNLIERDEDLYSVPDPGSLLDAWAEASRPPRERLVLRLPDKPHELLRLLVEKHPNGFAVSGEVAAELITPHLDSRQALLHCLDADALDQVQNVQIGLPVPVQPAGRIVAVRSDPRIGDFGSEIAGLKLVSSAQIYVDLFRDPGRGREAADRLRQEALGF